MKRTISFVTTNNGKFNEVSRWLLELDSSIELIQEAIDLPEIQSLDVEFVALAKAQEAWQILQKPLIIDDGGLYLEKYNQFPGTLSKWVYQGIGLEGIWKLAQDDPRAYFLCQLVYVDLEGFKNFEAKLNGIVIQPTETITFKQLPYCDIFIPEGQTETLAHLKLEKKDDQLSHRRKALIKLTQWLNTR